jgi:hypothetical protein
MFTSITLSIPYSNVICPRIKAEDIDAVKEMAQACKCKLEPQLNRLMTAFIFAQ